MAKVLISGGDPGYTETGNDFFPFNFSLFSSLLSSLSLLTPSLPFQPKWSVKQQPVFFRKKKKS